MYFQWKEEFETGIEIIDTQHKKLLEIGSKIEEIAFANSEGADYYDHIMQIIEELRSYTVYHFDYEEKLMAENHYENLDEHKIIHMFFVKKLDRLEKKDIDGDQKAVILELVKLLASWISDHILDTDVKYKGKLSITELKS